MKKKEKIAQSKNPDVYLGSKIIPITKQEVQNIAKATGVTLSYCGAEKTFHVSGPPRKFQVLKKQRFGGIMDAVFKFAYA